MSDSIDLIRLSEKKSFTFWIYAKIHVWWSVFRACPAPQLLHKDIMPENKAMEAR